MAGNSGFIVQLKNGKLARTYHRNELINGKAQVYECMEEAPILPNNPDSPKYCKRYSEKASLVDPDNVTIIGFID